MTGPLDAYKVAAHIADSEQRIEVQRQVVEHLQQITDDEERELRHLEDQLSAFRAFVTERGTS